MDFFMQDDKGVFYKVNEIQNITALTETSMNKSQMINTEPMSITFTGEILDSDGKNAIRKLIAGGDKGIYNGLTLKEEGYLSIENAWL